MSIWAPWTWFRSSNNYEESSFLTPIAQLTDEQVLDSPWAAAFDLTIQRHLKTFHLIRQMEDVAGQSFQIRRKEPGALRGGAVGGLSSGEMVIVNLDSFPHRRCYSQGTDTQWTHNRIGRMRPG